MSWNAWFQTNNIGLIEKTNNELSYTCMSIKLIPNFKRVHMKGRASLVPTLIQLINVLIGTNLNSGIICLFKDKYKSTKSQGFQFHWIFYPQSWIEKPTEFLSLCRKCKGIYVMMKSKYVRESTNRKLSDLTHLVLISQLTVFSL